MEGPKVLLEGAPLKAASVMNSLFTNSDSLEGLDNVYSDSRERGTKARDD